MSNATGTRSPATIVAIGRSSGTASSGNAVPAASPQFDDGKAARPVPDIQSHFVPTDNRRRQEEAISSDVPRDAVIAASQSALDGDINDEDDDDTAFISRGYSKVSGKVFARTKKSAGSARQDQWREKEKARGITQVNVRAPTVWHQLAREFGKHLVTAFENSSSAEEAINEALAPLISAARDCDRCR